MSVYAKVAIKLLQNKKIRNFVIAAIFTSFIISSVAPIALGLGAAYKAAQVITSAIEFVKDLFTEEELSSFDGSLSEDDLLRAFENGFSLTAGDEAGLRMKQDDYVYMLQRVSDYNHAGERKRTIDVEYEITRTESSTSTVTDEDGNVSESSETVTITDTDIKSVTVDNSAYEGLYAIDHRLLYFYIIESLTNTAASNKVLEEITPLDKDFNPIESSSDSWKKDSAYASRERIDRVFTYVTMSYDYGFDCLRNDKSEYSIDEAQEVPHSILTWSEDGADCTMYVPESFLSGGRSAYSYIENVINGQLLTETKENFSYDSMKSYARSLNPFLTDLEMEYFFEYAGAKDLFESFKGYGNDYTVGKKTGLNIYTMAGGGMTASFAGLTLTSAALDNLSFIFNRMLSLGFSEQMAAGACGNLWQETGGTFDPSAKNRRGTAVGLAQWMGERKTSLEAYASANGLSWNSLEAQTGFLAKELSEGRKGRIDALLEKWCGETAATVSDTDFAADAWCDIFEGCTCSVSGKLHQSHSAGNCASTKDGVSFQELLLRRKYAKKVYSSMRLDIAEEYVDLSSFQIPDNRSNHPVVYMAQDDFSSVPYGSGSVASCGCGVAASAMALSYCKGGTDRTKWISPSDVISLIEKATGSRSGCYVWGQGSSHDIASVTAEALGLRHSAVLSPHSLSESDVLERLRGGQVAVCSASRGYFTKNGHFIVITGCDDAGNLYVNDPNGSHASYSYTPFRWSFMQSASKGNLTSITFISEANGA